MARKPVHLLWGILFLLAGAFLGYAAARIGYITVRTFFTSSGSMVGPQWFWFSANFFPQAGLALYLVWAARDQLQRAGGQPIKRSRVGWGRLALGFWMVFGALKSHFAPEQSVFRADNEAEAAGMFVSMLLIVAVGISLMCLAFKPKAPKKEMPAETLFR